MKGQKLPDMHTELYEAITYENPDYRLKAFPNKTPAAEEPQISRTMFHEDIEIKYYCAGSATLMINNTMYPVQKGDIVVINPYDFHSYIDIDSQPGQYHLYMIGLDFFADAGSEGLNLRKELLEKGKRFQHVIRGNSVLAQYLLKTVSEMDKKEPFWHTKVSHLMGEFFIDLLRAYTCPDENGKIREEQIRYCNQISPALQKIHLSYTDSFDVDSLAELCGMSKYRFCHIFREMMGRSPIEYVNWYRVKVADAILAKSDISIQNVAAMTGFSSTNYFCRCYRRYNGCSATEHLRKNGSE